MKERSSSGRRGLRAVGSKDRRRRKKVILRRDGFACVRCGAKKNLTVDHIIPVAAGGSNRIANLQTLCDPCNAEKADTVTPLAYAMGDAA